ncbi:MAG: TM1812 family CRISPR-associated protein [Candidatus Helarchaeota archaeon]
MKTIIQVLGRLSSYKDASFIVDVSDEEISNNNNGFKLKSKLSSYCLYKYYKEYYKEDEIKVIYYIPESLITDYVEDENQVENYINNSENLINNYKDDFKNIIQENYNYEIRPIQSIGIYNQRESKYTLVIKNYIDNIIIQFIQDLLEFEGEIIVDISTGLNIYTYALSESVKSILVYNGLKNLMIGNNKLEIKFSIVPPVIMPREEWLYPISLIPVKAKSFFDLPYNKFPKASIRLVSLRNMDIKNNNRFRKLNQSSPKINKNITNTIIYPVFLAFNSLKFNTPLVFFNSSLISFSEDIEEYEDPRNIFRDILKFIDENKEITKDKNTIVINRFRVEKSNILNYLFTVGFYKSFKNFYNTFIKDKEPELDYIKEIFKEVYTKLELRVNKRFLERDIINIKEISESLNSNKCENLKKLMEEKRKNDKDIKEKGFSDPKRNFFAHSGFLSDFVKICKGNNDIIKIFYEKEKLNLIEAWLRKPE